MNVSDQDSGFLDKASAEFSMSIQRVDARVLARLQAARGRAVEAAGHRRIHRIPRAWTVPVGALAAVFVAVIGGALWWGGASSPPNAPFASSSNDDIPLVLTSDNLDMYSDLDFYQWLATQDQQDQNGDDDADNNNG